jgi:hypothetical protein
MKNKPDELAINPLSPLASPAPGFSIVLAEGTLVPMSDPSAPVRPSLSEKLVNKDRAPTRDETQQEKSISPNENLDELQRLRRDLELSRLESEQKHRDLERRIHELSERRLETQTTLGPELGKPSTITLGSGGQIQIADEAQSKLLVLRRGKYDKTRRLLAVSDSTHYGPQTRGGPAGHPRNGKISRVTAGEFEPRTRDI